MDWLRAAPHEVAFWSGAGISADAPTGGPLGREVTDRVMDHYMNENSRATVRELYSALRVGPAQYRPRLETVLGALVDAYGLEVVADVLSDLDVASPNRHHEWFARNVAEGGSHITANFDTCIERAGSAHALFGGDRIVHFHGALDGPSTLATLGARLRVIENGFPSEVVARLDSVLQLPATRFLTFVGYSGSDYFDATPYLISRAPLLRGKTVVWHQFSRSELQEQSLETVIAGDLPTMLAKAGVHLRVVSGSLDALRASVLPEWNDHPNREVQARGRRWKPKMNVAEPSRHSATLRLYGALGYRGGVLSLTSEQPARTADEWNILADAYWGAGMYRQALDAGCQASPLDTAKDRARRAERRGAFLWITGRLLRAERLLWKAIVLWTTPDYPAGYDAAAALMETYGRVIVHMRRTPDARWFINEARVANAERRLVALNALIAGREGVQWRARLENVGHALRNEVDENMPNHVKGFAESEALHSWLNYEHAELRQRGTRAGGQQLPPSGADYKILKHRQTAIGARADAARTLLLPGAAAHFTPLQALQGFRGVQMSSWHRMRLLGGFTAKWAVLLWRRMI